MGDVNASVTDKSWDGSASRFADEQYRRSAAACDPEGTPKEACFLSHHEPDGTTNRAGVHAAAGRAGSLSGHSADAVSRAKAHLRSHYSKLDEEPPDLIAAGADGEAFDVTVVDETAAPAQTMTWTAPVGVLEGVRTGDLRHIEPEALTWRELPLPLMANTTTSMGHDGAELVGRIDSIERVDASGMDDARNGGKYGAGAQALQFKGTFTSEAEATRVAGLIRDQFLKGVSVDLSDVQSEFRFLDEDGNPVDEEDDEVDILDIMFGDGDLEENVTAGRVMGLTITPFPAFEGAFIQMDDGPAMEPGQPDREQAKAGINTKDEYGERECKPCAEGGLVAAAGPVYPPRQWFDDPGLSEPTPLTIDEHGRVFGHLALWGVCHTGFSGRCVMAPKNLTGYTLFRTGAVKTAEGDLVSVGHVTLGGGHASTSSPLSIAQVMQHYDDSGTAAADVSAGEDAFGIWLAGALDPSLSEIQIRRLRASALSGDWREHGGRLELIAALAVNSPGFPVPRLVASSGHPVALVAAGGGLRPDRSSGAVRRLLDYLPELQRLRDERLAALRARVLSGDLDRVRARMAR